MERVLAKQGMRFAWHLTRPLLLRAALLSLI